MANGSDSRFLWGVGTSAYGTEGAFNEGDKGESVWDVYSHEKGYIKDGSNGDVADDSYHHIKDDVALLKKLGVNSYRFSVSWSRVIPDGKKQVSQIGLNYYLSLIEELEEAEIEPIVSLYDFDMPIVLSIEAGFFSPEMPKWFAFYAKTVAMAFGSKVKYWVPIRSPEISLGWAGSEGFMPPKFKAPPYLLYLGFKNLMMANAEAVKAIKAANKEAQIGFSAFSFGVFPKDENDPKSVQKAEEKYFKVSEKAALKPALYLDTLILRSLPKPIRKFEKDKASLESFIKNIATPIDFIVLETAGGQGVDDSDKNIKEFVDHLEDSNPTSIAESLYWSARFLYGRYNKPIILSPWLVTDVESDKNNDDVKRIEIIDKTLKVCGKLECNNILVKGFVGMSLLDCFEYSGGYTFHSGLVSVDRNTLARHEKKSFEFFKEAISKEEKQNG
jgi:beta-glucosidase